MNEDEIKKLISLKQEGPYWDFKREWYSQDKKDDLLHDIICMANNLSNRDAYIIIGIDEENDYSTFSIENDLNRRNTQQLVDFLREKSFAGGYRPTVSVESIFIDKDQIDIIIIHNSNFTPFYLTERYRSVNANNIYTRIMDSNIPKTKSADISQISMLWKKRFGLLTSPLERMMIYLRERRLWEYSTCNSYIEKQYYSFSPEYTIETVINNSKKEYSYYPFNKNGVLCYDINLCYHQTILISFEGILFLDYGYFTPIPKTDAIKLTEYNTWGISFKYFIKNSIEYITQEFFDNLKSSDQIIAHDKFMNCVLIFDTDIEKEKFKEFVFSNWKNKQYYYKDIYLPYLEEIEGYDMDKIKEEYLNSQILKKMLIEFRKNKIIR